jgi:hypothetical protein
VFYSIVVGRTSIMKPIGFERVKVENKGSWSVSGVSGTFQFQAKNSCDVTYSSGRAD